VTKLRGVAAVKAVIAIMLCGPLLWLCWLFTLEFESPGSALGADAGEAVVHFLGEWALIMLLIAYAVSPLKRLTKSSAIARSRRMIGLFAFSYVSLHILSYAYLYLEFEWQTLLEDFVERPYITAGMAAYSGLLVMACTSTNGWQRRLRRNWQRLHYVVYPVVILALVHLLWQTRDGFAEVVLYTTVFVALSAERLYRNSRVNRWLHGAH
jgi:sulfoxide reductase heme-binding subunit YedZ